MPRGEEWYYIDTADAVEIMAENAASDVANMVAQKKRKAERHGYARAASEARDEYAEGIAFYKHWCNEEEYS